MQRARYSAINAQHVARRWAERVEPTGPFGVEATLPEKSDSPRLRWNATSVARDRSGLYQDSPAAPAMPSLSDAGSKVTAVWMSASG